ncbi:MAG: ABC-type branched-subunit amino acid transport system substrate-binding protein [Arenicella sp.]|jgi:ABC-type branched-subunit amino acid transport system substrate-binding protein
MEIPMDTIRIACVARLDEKDSIHTQTFKRAVAVCSDYLSESAASFIENYNGYNFEIKCFDDEASAEGSIKAVEKVLGYEAHTVVGHFASASAQYAAPIYEAHNINLFLPASTAKDLTKHKTTYRICDNDVDYVRFIVKYLNNNNYRIGSYSHDQSFYGESICNNVKTFDNIQNEKRTNDISSDVPLTPISIYAARYFMSVDYLRKRSVYLKGKNIEESVLLTDDALSMALVKESISENLHVLVAGIEPKIQGPLADKIYEHYLNKWGEAPGTYFWETIASIQIAAQSINQNPSIKSWNTVIGPIKFDASGEANINCFGIWRLNDSTLIKLP